MKRRLARRVYRLLLYVAPRHLRRSHGREMERLFAETLEIETRRLGKWGYLFTWFAAIRDVSVSAGADRVGRITDGSNYRRPYPTHGGARKDSRSIKGFGLATIISDLKYALRGLARNPGFTTVAVMTLALGIGVNTAISTVVNNVLAPMAYDAPDQLVRVYATFATQGTTSGNLSAPDVRDWDARSTTMAAFALIDWGTVDLSGDGEPEAARVATVSTNFFTMLGTRPRLGRLLIPEDELRGNGEVVVVSHGLWQRRFGGEPGVIGHTITMDGAEHIVIGVLSEDFEEPSAAGGGPAMSQLWAPLGRSGAAANRGMQWLQAIGRMADGTTLEQAEAELNAIVAGLAEQHPETNPADMRVRLVPLHQSIFGDASVLLLVTLAATGFVLLIACANIASLVLARGAARVREFALRSALGAGRAQIIRLLFVESLALSLLAGAAGVTTASLIGGWLGAFAQGQVPRLTAATVDVRVLGFAVLISIGTAVVCGLFPAMSIVRKAPQDALKDGGKGSGLSHKGRRFQSYLVSGQMALSVILLIGAGLMVRSFTKLLNVETGYDRQNVLTFELSLPRTRYDDAVKIRTFRETLLEQLSSLPGVEATGAVDKLPLGTRWGCNGLAVGDRPIPTGTNWPCADGRAASSDYFAAMGISVLRGRAFNDADRAESEPVVAVNETMAASFWPGEDPIGKRVKWVRDVVDNRPWRTVVGLVEDVKHRGLEHTAQTEVYMPLTQAPDRRMSFVVRGAPDANRLTSLARSTVYELDPDLPIRGMSTIDESISASLAGPRLIALFLGALAAGALLLSLVGNYGVLAYFVAQRSHEVGVRMALGANRTEVVGMVVRQGMRMAVLGLGVGLVASFAMTRLLTGMLFEISPLDASTFVGTSLLLLTTAGLASYLPARRATRVDPVIALRSE